MKRLNLKKIRPILLIVSFMVVFCLIIGIVLFFKKPSNFTSDVKWGVTFSHTFARQTGYDWRKMYIDMLDELKPRILRIPVYWPEIEKEKDRFNFQDYDFMVEEAAKRGVKMTLVMGMKVPRWPECHIPIWARGLDRITREDQLLLATAEIVQRYKHKENIYAWQVENEPFLPFFGECPPFDSILLDTEIKLVKTLDPSRPVVVTDSGELSIWFQAARRGDIFGTTMYRIVWSSAFSKYIGYIKYPIPPKFFWLKANLVHLFYKDKPIIVSELQAEPWAPGYLFEFPVSEQKESLDIEKFNDNIEYARKVGFPEAYLWGVEWWYWMKEKNQDPEFWNAAKELFSEGDEDNEHVARYIIDGDTIELEDGSRARLIGIDAPEKDEFYYKEAKDKLTEMLLDKKVNLEKDISDFDVYGRQLRYIFLDGDFINLEMVKAGYAEAVEYLPDVKYQSELSNAENEARNQKIGIWSRE